MARATGQTGMVLLDPAGVIRYWSTGAETLLGHAAAEVVGSSLDVIIPEDFRSRHWAGWSRAWERGEIRDNLVAMIPVLCADGEVRRFAGRLQPLRGPHGDLVGAMGIFSAPDGRDAGLYALT